MSAIDCGSAALGAMALESVGTPPRRDAACAIDRDAQQAALAFKNRYPAGALRFLTGDRFMQNNNVARRQWTTRALAA